MYPRLLACSLALAVCASCGGNSNSDPPRSDAGICVEPDASKAVCADGGGPNYARVRSIVATACVPCHNEETAAMDGGTWPLTTRDDLASWTEVITEDILNCSMPPADGGVPMHRRDRDLLVQWLLCGAPK
jgi:uncharacterized membrane protein